MKLFSAVIPQVRHVLVYGRWFTPSVVVLFVGLEMFGRKATSDVHDTVGALVLMAILAGITIRHRANPIGWVKQLGALTWVIARLGDRFRIELGPDLKGTPKLPGRVPPVYHLVLLALSAWALLAGLVWWFFPGGWRAPLVTVSYTAYLGLMSILWGLMFVAALGGVYLPVRLLTRLAMGAGQTDLRMSFRQLTFLTCYLSAVTAAAWYLPLWLPFAFMGLFWLVVAGTLFFPTQNASVRLIWRSVGSSQVYSVSPRRILFDLIGICIVLLTGIVVSSSGGGFLHGIEPILREPSMPLTMMLGNCVAWLAPGFLLSAISFVLIVWLGDPARPRRPAFAISGVAAEFHRSLRKITRQRGWNLHFDRAERHDVKLRLVPENRSEVTEFEPGWPLAVSLADLEGKLLYERAARRDEIQLRREFLGGLETLMKRAKRHDSPGGCGFWFAPHLWFVVGLTRDEITGADEEPAFLTEIIGPTYEEVFGRQVRQ